MEAVIVAMFIGRFTLCDVGGGNCSVVFDEASPYTADACLESYRSLIDTAAPRIIVDADCIPVDDQEI